jgi:hypothetical protein
MSITMESLAFAQGGKIPKRHTGEGQDLSPALRWTGVPAGTRELALICDDPDAPTPRPWVHWVIYAIPGNVVELPEGVPPSPRLEQPAGAMQGRNSWSSGQTIGYRGPMPPPGHGLHHYHFKLYALDAPLYLKPEVDKEMLLDAMDGHVLAKGELVGTYQR